MASFRAVETLTPIRRAMTTGFRILNVWNS